MRICRQAWREPRELCWLLYFQLHSSREKQTLRTLDSLFLWMFQHICGVLTLHKANGSYWAVGVMVWRCSWRPDACSRYLWGSLNGRLLIWNRGKSTKQNNFSFNTRCRGLEQNYVNCKLQRAIQIIKLSKIRIQTEYSLKSVLQYYSYSHPLT